MFYLVLLMKKVSYKTILNYLIKMLQIKYLTGFDKRFRSLYIYKLSHVIYIQSTQSKLELPPTKYQQMKYHEESPVCFMSKPLNKSLNRLEQLLVVKLSTISSRVLLFFIEC